MRRLRAHESAPAIDPKNYEALCKASQSAIGSGEFEPKPAVRSSYFAWARACLGGGVVGIAKALVTE